MTSKQKTEIAKRLDTLRWRIIDIWDSLADMDDPDARSSLRHLADATESLQIVICRLEGDS